MNLSQSQNRKLGYSRDSKTCELNLSQSQNRKFGPDFDSDLVTSSIHMSSYP